MRTKRSSLIRLGQLGQRKLIQGLTRQAER